MKIRTIKRQIIAQLVPDTIEEWGSGSTVFYDHHTIPSIRHILPDEYKDVSLGGPTQDGDNGPAFSYRVKVVALSTNKSNTYQYKLGFVLDGKWKNQYVIKSFYAGK